jgi:cytochrome c
VTRRSRLHAATPFILAGALCTPLLSGCERLKAYMPGLNPDAARGIELANRYGCASCHEIPGAAVKGRIGPSLRGVRERAYLAGGLPNTPEQMVELIRFPNRARRGTLMPYLGVSGPDARELVAFLHTLR